MREAASDQGKLGNATCVAGGRRAPLVMEISSQQKTILDRIVEGRLAKYYEEVCLYEQPFIKENTITIAELIKSKIAKLGENISVARFVRFKVGDTGVAEEVPVESA